MIRKMRTLFAYLLLATPAFAGPDDDAVAIQIAIANATTPTLAAPPRVTPPVVISVVKPAKASGYPSRSQSGRTWTGCPDWRHMTTGEHAGQFDATWLRTLDANQVQALHADAHEGRVQWQFVQRPARTPPAVVCPDGRCPVRRVYRVR